MRLGGVTTMVGLENGTLQHIDSVDRRARHLTVALSLKCRSQHRTSTSLPLVLFFVAVASVDLFNVSTLAQRTIHNSTVSKSNDTSNSSKPTAEDLRLPTSLSPLWYNFTMKVYLPGYVELPPEKNLTFDSTLQIKFRVNNATNRIVMSAFKLNVSSNVDDYELRQESSNNRIPVRNVTLDTTLKMITLQVKCQLKTGQFYYLKTSYSNAIVDEPQGLYWIQYTNPDGKERYLAVTHMEPSYLRRVVPCFDEPEFKAIWNIKVIHPRGTWALSNGIELTAKPHRDDSNWMVTTFGETPPMSSYLFAVTVTDFGYNEGTTQHGTRIRIWARKEALDQTEYAHSCALKVMDFYEDFYGIPFPLEIQDMIALPEFATGAMENWGLLIYRESLLFYDSRLYTPRQRLHVAEVVAHELAHQWFGNLVTMKWWNDLWLNEGFATYMQYYGANAISDGNFRMGNIFLSDAVNKALDADARADSHPLSTPISNALDIVYGFDFVTYFKGASIVHMIQDVMGRPNFKKGINIYLNRYKWSNTEDRDLWAALNDAMPNSTLSWNGEKLDIVCFATRWTQKVGYPVVQMRRLNATTIELHQIRFRRKNSTVAHAAFRSAIFWEDYDIPIWYAVNGEKKPMSWLRLVSHLTIKPEELLILNEGAKGFYRVNYDVEGWQKIIRQFNTNHTVISVRSRALVIEDAFTLAEAGYVSYEIPLNISTYLASETEHLPWKLAIEGFHLILSKFEEHRAILHLRNFWGPLIAPLFQRVDWESLNTTYLNDSRFSANELDYEMIRQYCDIRHPDCTNQLTSTFKTSFLLACSDEQLASNCSRVAVPIRSEVYCEGVRQSGEDVWNRVLAYYKREQWKVERDRLLAALSCSEDPTVIRRLLLISSNKSDPSIRPKDASRVWFGASKTEVGKKVIFDMVDSVLPHLHKEIPEERYRGNLIMRSSSKIRHERKESEKWLKQHSAYLIEWFMCRNEERRVK